MSFCGRFLLCLALSLAPGYVAAASFLILNFDGPGEGFNDETVVDEDDGFPAGTTLGFKRMSVLFQATQIWADKLQSGRELIIRANFDPLDCSGGSAILGSAGPTAIAHSYPGLPFQNTDYVIAAAEAISNQAILPPSSPHISVRFNSAVDNNCFGGGKWWYGTERYPESLGNRILLLPMMLHELAHSLGFASFVCINQGGCGTTPMGGYSTGRLDAWSRFQADTTQQKLWSNMSDAQRAASITNQFGLVWEGPAVNAGLNLWATNGAGLTNGGMQLHTPTTANPSTSVSHWTLNPQVRLLMKPGNLSTQNQNVRTTDLTDCVFRDIGWTVNTSQCALGVNQAPVLTLPSEFRALEDAPFVRLPGAEIADPDSGNASVEVTVTVTAGFLSGPTTAFGSAGSGFPLKLTGSVESVNNILDAGGIGYVPVPNSDRTESITFDVSDLGRHGSGGVRTTSQTVPLVIDPVNDPPFIYSTLGGWINSFQLSEHFSNQWTLSFSGFAVNDDAGSQPIRLDIITSTGTLEAVSAQNVVVSGTTTSKSFIGSIAAIQTYFSEDRFRWVMGDDPDQAGSIIFHVSDQGNTGSGGTLTDTRQVSLGIERVNDAPALQVPASADFIAGGSMPVDGIRVVDPDARSGTMVLTVDADIGSLTTGTPDGLVSISGFGARGVRLDGTRDNINTFLALRKLVFVSSSNADRNAVLSLRVLDNGNTGDAYFNLEAVASVNLVANPIFSNGFE